MSDDEATDDPIDWKAEAERLGGEVAQWRRYSRDNEQRWHAARTFVERVGDLLDDVLKEVEDFERGSRPRPTRRRI